MLSQQALHPCQLSYSHSPESETLTEFFEGSLPFLSSSFFPPASFPHMKLPVGVGKARMMWWSTKAWGRACQQQETHFVRGVWRGRTNLESRKALKQHQLANVLRGPSRPEAEKMRNQLFQNTTGLQYTTVASWQKSHSPSPEQTLGWLFRLLLGNIYLHMMISSMEYQLYAEISNWFHIYFILNPNGSEFSTWES